MRKADRIGGICGLAGFARFTLRISPVRTNVSSTPRTIFRKNANSGLDKRTCCDIMDIEAEIRNPSGG